MRERITVSAEIKASLQHTWECWTSPGHIMNWNFASDEWCCPRAANDLRKGGKFSARMEARDGSMGFDFEGIYDEVVPCERISYKMSDGREVHIVFEKLDDSVRVSEIFDAENENPVEMQRAGWQAILNNFKNYTENSL